MDRNHNIEVEIKGRKCSPGAFMIDYSQLYLYQRKLKQVLGFKAGGNKKEADTRSLTFLSIQENRVQDNFSIFLEASSDHSGILFNLFKDSQMDNYVNFFQYASGFSL